MSTRKAQEKSDDVKSKEHEGKVATHLQGDASSQTEPSVATATSIEVKAAPLPPKEPVPPAPTTSQDQPDPPKTSDGDDDRPRRRRSPEELLAERRAELDEFRARIEAEEEALARETAAYNASRPAPTGPVPAKGAAIIVPGPRPRNMIGVELDACTDFITPEGLPRKARPGDVVKLGEATDGDIDRWLASGSARIITG